MSAIDECRKLGLLPEEAEKFLAQYLSWRERKPYEMPFGSAIVEVIASLAAMVVEQAGESQCGAGNPHHLVPSRCPSCGETLVPVSCMELAQASYRDGQDAEKARADEAERVNDQWEVEIARVMGERNEAERERDHLKVTWVNPEELAHLFHDAYEVSDDRAARISALELERAEYEERIEAAEAQLAAATEQLQELHDLRARFTESGVLSREDEAYEAGLEKGSFNNVLRLEWSLRFILDDMRSVDMYYVLPEAKMGDVDDAISCLAARWDAERYGIPHPSQGGGE